MDQNEHDYMHAHNIPHTHGTDDEHTHDHTPVQEQAPCPGQEDCNQDCSTCPSADPKAELIALMRYMVNHNTAHANELAQLAEKLRAMGETAAAEQVLAAVSDFEKGNMRLSTVLAALNN